jgi:hypothetical protein
MHVGPKYVSEKDVDGMVSLNDDVVFLEYLQRAGQPVFETWWGALHHGASGRFELYYFDGQYFASLSTDCCDDRAGPFKKPFDAAERFGGIFEFEYGEEHGISGAIHFGTNWNDAGPGRISTSMAERMFEELTGLAGSPLSFHWCEATPGKLFKDPFHDEMGKALLQLQEATKSGSLDQLDLAQANLEGPKKTPIVSDHVLGDEAKYFTSAFDSFLMKVPLDAKGKLKAYVTEWVRLCLPKRVGKKTLVVGVLPNHKALHDFEETLPFNLLSLLGRELVGVGRWVVDELREQHGPSRS